MTWGWEVEGEEDDDVCVCEGLWESDDPRDEFDELDVVGEEEGEEDEEWEELLLFGLLVPFW